MTDKVFEIIDFLNQAEKGVRLNEGSAFYRCHSGVCHF